jgi:hypothetical protein
MDVFSTELRIRLSFVKTSEFRGWGDLNPPDLTRPPLLGMPLSDGYPSAMDVSGQLNKLTT